MYNNNVKHVMKGGDPGPDDCVVYIEQLSALEQILEILCDMSVHLIESGSDSSSDDEYVQSRMGKIDEIREDIDSALLENIFNLFKDSRDLDVDGLLKFINDTHGIFNEQIDPLTEEELEEDYPHAIDIIDSMIAKLENDLQELPGLNLRCVLYDFIRNYGNEEDRLVAFQKDSAHEILDDLPELMRCCLDYIRSLPDEDLSNFHSDYADGKDDGRFWTTFHEQSGIQDIEGAKHYLPYALEIVDILKSEDFKGGAPSGDIVKDFGYITAYITRYDILGGDARADLQKSILEAYDQSEPPFYPHNLCIMKIGYISSVNNDYVKCITNKSQSDRAKMIRNAQLMTKNPYKVHEYSKDDPKTPEENGHRKIPRDKDCAAFCMYCPYFAGLIEAFLHICMYEIIKTGGDRLLGTGSDKEFSFYLSEDESCWDFSSELFYFRDIAEEIKKITVNDNANSTPQLDQESLQITQMFHTKEYVLSEVEKLMREIESIMINKDRSGTDNMKACLSFMRQTLCDCLGENLRTTYNKMDQLITNAETYLNIF